MIPISELELRLKKHASLLNVIICNEFMQVWQDNRHRLETYSRKVKSYVHASSLLRKFKRIPESPALHPETRGARFEQNWIQKEAEELKELARQIYESQYRNPARESPETPLNTAEPVYDFFKEPAWNLFNNYRYVRCERTNQVIQRSKARSVSLQDCVISWIPEDTCSNCTVPALPYSMTLLKNSDLKKALAEHS